MKKYEREIKIILDILIAYVFAIILRNYFAETRNGLYWGGELAIPLLATWWHFGLKEQLKSFIRDLRGDR